MGDDLYKVYRAPANATHYSIINGLITILTPHNVKWMQNRKENKRTRQSILEQEQRSWFGELFLAKEQDAEHVDG